MNRIVFWCFIISLALSGCDTYNPVDYNVKNDSNQKLKVIFNSWDHNNGMYIKDDSIVTIESHSKKTLVVREIIGAGVWNPEYGNDTIWLINRILIYKNDTSLIDRNFRLMTLWEYNTLSAHHAELNLRITDEDLN